MNTSILISLDFNGKRVILHPLPPSRRPRNSASPTKTTNDTFCKDIDDSDPVFCLTNALDVPTTPVPLEMATLFDNYARLCKDPFAGTLPPVCTIQHRIQL